MRLFDAILDANHRALAGDKSAGLHLADFANELPVITLTCIDPRLNHLFPGVLALPEEQFIWLRNAGNIVIDPLSSTMRSIALSCVVKGGREIAVIGHTDCKISQTSINELTERFRTIGIDRQQLPEDLTEFFGVFANERQNVIRGVECIRRSPLIGPRIPVHGLIVNTQSGQLEWVVNGYEVLAGPANDAAAMRLPTLGGMVGDLATGAGFDFGEMKFPDSKIGETASPAIPSLSVPKSGVVPSSLPAPPTNPPLPPPSAFACARGAIPPPIQAPPDGRDKKR